MSVFRYVSCEQQMKDCFAYEADGGGCRVLRDTRFTRPCPFYKLKEQYERECFESRKRMLERIREDDEQ